MKTINKSFGMIYIVLIIISFTMYSCKTNQKNTSKKHYLEGIYCTEKMPADIGEPYRIYLKFKKDGTVLSINSSLECDSVSKIIENNYASISKYTLTKKDSIKFVFINNRVNNQEYTEKYNGKIAKEKSLKFTTIIIRKGRQPYKGLETYINCK